MSRLPIIARAGRALRRLVTGAPAITPATAFDFSSLGFFAQRRVSPQEARMVLDRAAHGDLPAQWELFDLMEDTWPRLLKNLGELRTAASRATYSVQPYTERGRPPAPSAQERAELVDQSLRNWSPRPGTLELSFEDMLFDALDAYGKGVSVLELHWHHLPDGILPRAAHTLAPRRYGWNDDGSELGLRTDDRRGWMPFPDDHFLIAISRGRTGAPGATARLRALTPYWAGITFGWEWLLANAQIFGVPFRWATYDRNDPGLGPVLRDMLRAMGACGYGAFPDGTKLEFKEVSQNVTGNPQVVIQELANQACDLLILGQELSASARPAGLGNGASELQGGVRADRLEAAAQWCADLLNYQLVPAILRANWGDTDEPPAIVPDLEAEPDPKALIERDKILLDSGIALPKAWFYERHKIPVPAAREEVITGRPPALPGMMPMPERDKGQVPGDRGQPGADGAPAEKEDEEKAVKARSAAALATDALYRARALTLLSSAERAALAPLLDALAAVERAGDAHLPAALKAFEAALAAHAPRLLAEPSLAAAWEKVLAPAAAEGAANALKP
jgi:phage gp29-like protein